MWPREPTQRFGEARQAAVPGTPGPDHYLWSGFSRGFYEVEHLVLSRCSQRAPWETRRESAASKDCAAQVSDKELVDPKQRSWLSAFRALSSP